MKWPHDYTVMLHKQIAKQTILSLVAIALERVASLIFQTGLIILYLFLLAGFCHAAGYHEENSRSCFLLCLFKLMSRC